MSDKELIKMTGFISADDESNIVFNLLKRVSIKNKTYSFIGINEGVLNTVVYEEDKIISFNELKVFINTEYNFYLNPNHKLAFIKI